MLARLALPAVVLLTLIVAGCGDSGASTSIATATAEADRPLSKGEFIARADAICTETREQQQALKDEVEELQGPDASSDDVQRIAELFAQASEETRKEVTQVRELSPPPADRAVVARMLATVDSQLALTEAYAKALEEGDLTVTQSLIAKIGPVAAKAKGMAQGYGFEVCGTEG